MFKRNKHHGSQKLEEFPDEGVEMNPGDTGNSKGKSKEKLPDTPEEKGKESPEDPGGMEASLPLMFRLRGTVIKGIWWQILLVVLWSTAVVGVYMNVPEVQYKFKPILIQLMGVVCGLLLAFRSNSAYDRYWEGRKYWSTMTLQIRNLTRCIWINIKEESSGDIVEKKSAINLLIAFAVATKHYLREEYDYDFADLLTITNHLDWLHTPSSNQPMSDQNKQKEKATVAPESVVVNVDGSDDPSKGKRQSIKKVAKSLEDIPEIPLDAAEGAHPKQFRFKAHDIATPTNIPLELSYYIGSYINSVRIREKCDGGTIGAMSASLSVLMECLTGFERILRTPIPLAYSVHLHHSIWIYILALPFQLVDTNGYWTILVVGITAFFLLGILAIGWEIENPFGYDDNDLPLDDFCKVLRREIEVIVSHRAMIPEDWVFRKSNKPFAPECKLNAVELSEKPVQDVRDMLVVRGVKISASDVLSRQESERITNSAKKRKVSGGSTRSAPGAGAGDASETRKMLP